MRNTVITKCTLWHMYHCFQKFLVLTQDTTQSRGFIFYKYKNDFQSVVSELPIDFLLTFSGSDKLT